MRQRDCRQVRRRPASATVPLLALLFAACLLLSRPVQAASLSSEQYWQLITESKEIIAGLEQLPAAGQREQLQSLAARWHEVEEVTFGDGRSAPLDTTLLTALMRADPPNLARLQGLLHALETGGQSWPTAAAHGTGDLASLGPILARPEFQWPEEQATLWQQWRERLQQAFLAFVEWLFPEGAALPAGGWGTLLTLISAALLLLVLAYAGRGLLHNLVTEAGVDANEISADEALTADVALQQARTASAGDDYRTAVRYLYLSTLLVLAERGVLRYDRSLTNREYLRGVAHQPAVAAHLAEIVDLFDRVWYGYQPVDKSSYARYNEQVRALQRAAKE
jgi:hypothetical protein